MSNSSVYDLLHKMNADDIILAYKGEINGELLQAVYSMMDKHLEEKKTPAERKKKFFHILVESLQNVFHHQTAMKGQTDNHLSATGFVIKRDGETSYKIVTGNYLYTNAIESLRQKLDEVNSLSPLELREQYRKSLAGNEYSDKGGAGLGIIEMARKSGEKLNYEFTKVNDEYSFFSLAISIP